MRLLNHQKETIRPQKTAIHPHKHDFHGKVFANKIFAALFCTSKPEIEYIYICIVCLHRGIEWRCCGTEGLCCGILRLYCGIERRCCGILRQYSSTER